MFEPQRDPRSVEVYQAFCANVHQTIGQDTFSPEEGEILLVALPSVKNNIDSEMVRTALADFDSFLHQAFHLPKKTSAFLLETSIQALSGGNKREHRICIEKDRIEIIGASEWGVASGLYHLQRLLRLRSAPAVKKGSIHSAPSLDPALAYLAFKRDTTSDLDFPEAYHENYLLRIARAGYTGFHINLSSNVFSVSQAFPELNNPDAEDNFATLRKIVAIAKKCCLEVYLSYYSVPLAKEHPLFQRLPEMRGSRIVSTNSLHPLCFSSAFTLQYYREHFIRLFSEVNELGGVLLIVGCEGFLHCHTASELDREQRSTCPACGKGDAEEIVASMMNQLASAMHTVSPSASCIVWTYGIHTWCEDQGARLLSLLSEQCQVMSNFDSDDKFRLEGCTARCFDYSLRCVGPSKMFRRHEKIARAKSLPILAKCESGSSLEFYNLPSFPAYTRWGRKFAGILRSAASGALFNWKFMGFLGEISQELAAWMSWQGYQDYEFLLKKIITRDFGQEHIASIMQAWHCFDQAMEFHPFSIGTAGYFKGPFYIAFTQPLILDPMNPGNLCEDFWISKDAGHLLGKSRRALFVSSLSWVRPFGVDACLRALRKMEALWQQGCGLIPDAPRTEKHLALCQAVLCMLRTSINMLRFFAVRDKLFSQKYSRKKLRERLVCLRDIASDEYENASVGLHCMEKNPMLGFQYNYRYSFTRKMAESKLEHTRKLIEQDIPQLWYGDTFTTGRKAEWLW